jgi:hypothetical protein
VGTASAKGTAVAVIHVVKAERSVSPTTWEYQENLESLLICVCQAASSNTRLSAKAIVAISRRRINAPVMTSRHLMRMVTALAMFIVDFLSRAQILRPILVIDSFDEKSYMDPELFFAVDAEKGKLKKIR